MARRHNKRRADEAGATTTTTNTTTQPKQATTEQPATIAKTDGAVKPSPKPRTLARRARKHKETVAECFYRLLAHAFRSMHPVIYYSFMPAVIFIGMRTEPRPSFKDLFSIT